MLLAEEGYSLTPHSLVACRSLYRVEAPWFFLNQLYDLNVALVKEIIAQK